MFTGIIQAVGEVASLQRRGGDVRLRVRTGALDLGDVTLGEYRKRKFILATTEDDLTGGALGMGGL